MENNCDVDQGRINPSWQSVHCFCGASHSMVGRFTKAQKRKFFHTMKAQKSYYVSATAVITENRNTVYETANWTRYALCTVYHSTSSQVYAHQLLPASVKM